MSPEERAALAAIQSTFVKHESLRQRWRTATPPPAGSELAQADAVWPHLPFTEHARQALVTAWDHFDVVRVTIDARRLFPTGLNGVLRGALVASSLALWLVGPDDPDLRVQRALSVADAWYQQRITYQDDLLAWHGYRDKQGVAQLERFKDDKRDLQKVRTMTPGLRPTGILEWASEHRWGAGSAESKQAMLEWQRLGGDAHALGWQLMMQDITWGQGASGPIEAAVTGNMQNIAQLYMCAWQMFVAALQRFDQLATVSPGTSGSGTSAPTS